MKLIRNELFMWNKWKPTVDNDFFVPYKLKRIINIVSGSSPALCEMSIKIVELWGAHHNKTKYIYNGNNWKWMYHRKNQKNKGPLAEIDTQKKVVAQRCEITHIQIYRIKKSDTTPINQI